MAENTAVTEPALGTYVLYTGSKGRDKLALVVGNSSNFDTKPESSVFCEDCQVDHVTEGRALPEGALVVTIFSISGAVYTRVAEKATEDGQTGVWKAL